jgi:polyphenol oxidase
LIRKKVGEIQWLEFEIFAEEPTLIHGVFLRHGGVSSGSYTSLNLGKDIGDLTENILENRRLVLSALSVPACISCHQVHGNEVKLVTDPSQNIGECDGITTQQTNLGLFIKHADCQAAIIYDPIERALANVHAGWRGNVKNIYRAAVQKMVQSFGSKPQNLLVGISPSIGPKNAEFKNYKLELPEEFWDFQVKPTYFDLWQIARHQFEEEGVLSHHIQIAEICTVDHPADYFSYRRDKTTGRHATVAMLRSFS